MERGWRSGGSQLGDLWPWGSAFWRTQPIRVHRASVHTAGQGLLRPALQRGVNPRGRAVPLTERLIVGVGRPRGCPAKQALKLIAAHCQENRILIRGLGTEGKLPLSELPRELLSLNRKHSDFWRFIHISHILGEGGEGQNK